MHKQFSTHLRKAVALKAAVGFVGHRHFDQAQIEETADLFVQFSGHGGVTQRSRQFGLAGRLSTELQGDFGRQLRL